MNPSLSFGRRFQTLPTACYRRVKPSPLPDPYWVAINHELARQLGMTLSDARDDPALSFLSGNACPPGSEPIAARYAGHQFGVYVPQLGDGRALLLGDLDWNGARAEIQLKGAGQTPFSRMGDGRAVLRSSVREYLCSEAMHGLGIPTTRALCLIGSNQPVWREQQETAAVLTRVAHSFVRFGSFEVLYHQNELRELTCLADFVIRHHFPECRDAPAPYAALFAAVSSRTASLVAQWQAVGFCHGVMNSDNMSILGLTLDYGPFAFMDGFDAGYVCNHSDYAARYAFKQQPRVALWNLQCLASALLPLAPEAALVQILTDFRLQFESAYLGLMRAKLGLLTPAEDDGALIESLLLVLHADRVDYTRFFRSLSTLGLDAPESDLSAQFADPALWLEWRARYRARLLREERQDPARRQAMLSVNPKYILRNYLAETAIAEARDQHDFAEIERLARCLAHPFDEQPECEAYAAASPAWAAEISLSCSS